MSTEGMRKATDMAQDYVVRIYSDDPGEIGEEASGDLLACRNRYGVTYLTLRQAKRLADQVARLVGAPVAVTGADDDRIAYLA